MGMIHHKCTKLRRTLDSVGIKEGSLAVCPSINEGGKYHLWAMAGRAPVHEGHDCHAQDRTPVHHDCQGHLDAENQMT